MAKNFLTSFSIVCLGLSLGGKAQAKTDFKTEILPILEGRCLKCHKGPHEENGKVVKPKGDVRLDAAWVLIKASKDVTPITPGDVAHSAIVEVVSLPKDDDKFMPPEGKADPLNPQEIAKLKAWITEGADFGGWEGNQEGRPADANHPAVKAVVKDREHDVFYKKLAEGVKPAPDDVIKKLTAAGAQIAPLQPGSPLLHVDFLTGVGKCNDASVEGLAVIKDNIAHLDLARTSVTDASLKTAAGFPKLARLDLRKTKVTDKGLESLTGLKHLEYLNLFETGVTDAGLATLAKMKSLKHVFLFESQVTDAGVKNLQTALPEAEVVGNVVITAPPPQAAGAKKRKK